MSDAKPSNRTIQKTFKRFAPELIRRYGRAQDCTFGQVTKTAKDLTIPEDVFPYICAAFLGREEYLSAQKQNDSVHWGEVENRTQRILHELIHIRGDDHDFYESGIGLDGT